MNDKSRTPSTIMAIRRVMSRGFLVFALCSIAIVGSAWSATANLIKPAAIVGTASASSARADQPVPIAIYDTFSVSPTTVPPSGFDVSFVGVFTAIIGTDVVTGASRMDVCLPPVPGGVVSCRFTYVRSDGEGSFVLASVCVLSQGHGA